MTRHPCPPRFVVHGLTPGEQYIFRVKAVNAVGTSENSQESDAIKVQAALSKSGAAPSRFGVLNGLSFLQEQTFVMPFRVSSEEMGGWCWKCQGEREKWRDADEMQIKEDATAGHPCCRVPAPTLRQLPRGLRLSFQNTLRPNVAGLSSYS